MSREEEDVTAVLSSRVHMVMKRNQEDDDVSKAVDKKYNLDINEDYMLKDERDEYIKRVGEVKVKQNKNKMGRQEADLSGEILRGLGVNELNYA